jgi:hypothetical protein
MTDTTLLYHWINFKKAATALKLNTLRARRWIHYIELEDRFAKGTSWSKEPTRWAIDDAVLLVADQSRLQNSIFSINGSRTYHQTRGILDPCHDPNTYKWESTEPDEEFVEGTILNLSQVLHGIYLPAIEDKSLFPLHTLAWSPTPSHNSKIETLRTIIENAGIPILTEQDVLRLSNASANNFYM